MTTPAETPQKKSTDPFELTVYRFPEGSWETWTERVNEFAKAVDWLKQRTNLPVISLDSRGRCRFTINWSKWQETSKLPPPGYHVHKNDGTLSPDLKTSLGLRLRVDWEALNVPGVSNFAFYRHFFPSVKKPAVMHYSLSKFDGETVLFKAEGVNPIEHGFVEWKLLVRELPATSNLSA